MIFSKFMERANKIVSAHRAEYICVFYMKGGFVGEVLSNPITEVISDVGAAVTGQEWAIPFINAGETAAGDLTTGQSIGKSLGQGALAGGEALGAQELAGAVGVGQGNTAFNNALGITGDNPAGTGLPDIGKGISNLSGGSSAVAGGSNAGTFNAGSIGGFDTSGLAPGGAVNQGSVVNGAGTLASTGGGAISSASPVSGMGGGSAATAAPSAAGAGSIGGDVTLNDPNSSLASAATAAGGSNPGTQGLAVGQPNTFTGFGSGPGGANIPGAIDNFGGAFTPAAPSQSIGQKLTSSLTSPSALIAGTGLAADALKQTGLVGNNTPKGENQINRIAAQENQQGQQLQSYLQSGTLPAGLQQTLNQATEAAKATIRSKYAAMGSSGSSAERDELAAVDANAVGQGSQLALQLLQTGINETGAASTLYEQLLKSSESSEGGLNSAIANFASAAGGGGLRATATQPQPVV